MNSIGNVSMNISPQFDHWENCSKLGFDLKNFFPVSLKSYKHLCYVLNFSAVSLLKHDCEYSSHHLWQCLQNWDFSLGVIWNILTKCFLEGGCYWKNIYKVKSFWKCWFCKNETLLFRYILFLLMHSSCLFLGLVLKLLKMSFCFLSLAFRLSI